MEDGQKTSIKNPVIDKPSPKVTKSGLFFIANLTFLLLYWIFEVVLPGNQYGCYQCSDRQTLILLFGGGSFVLSILIMIKSSISRSKIKAGIEEKTGSISTLNSFIAIYCVLFVLVVVKFAFPIHDAVQSGSRALVLFNLVTGASPNEPSGFRRLTSSYNERETYLFNFNFNQRNSSGLYSRLTPLHLVQNKSMAQFLIEHGADVHSRASQDLTPLHLARNEEIVEVLIRNGADVSAKSKEGATPIFTAANEEVLRTLIENGADVNAQDNHGLTVLHILADGGYWHLAEWESILKLLVKHGADININSKYYGTPFHLTVSNYSSIEKSGEIIEAFLKYGANINARNSDGKTPLDIAENPEMKKLLVKYGAKPS